MLMPRAKLMLKTMHKDYYVRIALTPSNFDFHQGKSEFQSPCCMELAKNKKAPAKVPENVFFGQLKREKLKGRLSYIPQRSFAARGSYI